MNRSHAKPRVRPVLAALLLGAAAGAVAGQDLLLFTDGSSLPGRLVRAEAGEGLTWDCPYASTTAVYRFEGIASVGLSPAPSPPGAGEALVELTNGDVLRGRVAELDGERLVLERGNGRTVVDRRMVRLVEPQHETSPYLYRGPDGLAGWTIRPEGPNSWKVLGDTLLSPGGPDASLARRLPPADAMAVQFDVTWKGPPGLQVRMWENAKGWFELAIQPKRIYLCATYAPTATVPNTRRPGWSTASRPFRMPSGRHRVTLLASRENLFTLLVDSQPVAIWRPSASGPVTGDGLRFVTPQPLELSRIRVYAHTDGALGEGGAAPAGDRDIVTFVNGDAMPCDILGAGPEGIRCAIEGTEVQLAAERVLYLEFAAAARPEPRRSGGGDLRVHLEGGERITLVLHSLDGERLAGQADALGAVTLARDRIQRIEMNLGRGDASP